jgi:hypothetical protein
LLDTRFANAVELRTHVTRRVLRRSDAKDGRGCRVQQGQISLFGVGDGVDGLVDAGIDDECESLGVAMDCRGYWGFVGRLASFSRLRNQSRSWDE